MIGGWWQWVGRRWAWRHARPLSVPRISVGVVVPSVADRPLDLFPQSRRPPASVLEGLRREDPSLDLLYMGWGTWMLVSLRPRRHAIERGQRILERNRSLLELWRANPIYQANPGAFRRLMGRHDYGLIATLGASPIDLYRVQGEPTYAIVDDVRWKEYMLRTQSDDELDRSLHDEKERQREVARAEFSDMERANAVCRYVNTLSHWNGYDPQKQPHRSGFKVITRIPA